MTKMPSLLRVAGLDIGFSAVRPTAGIGFFVENRFDLRNCLGLNACEQIVQAGPHDIIAIDGPITPEHQNSERRNVEQLFCKGLFQRRCKPGILHTCLWLG